MTERRTALVFAVALAGLLAGYLALGAVYARCERPNQDEGWYLYAARLVRSGQRPCVDFAYVQPPLLPYVYGAVGADRSVAAGRTTSVVCGSLAVLLVGLAGWRGAGPVGGLVAAGAFALVPFVLSQQSIVKAYALTDLWLAATLACAVGGSRRGRTVAAVPLALACLTRSSAAPAAVAYGLWLLYGGRRRDLPGALFAGLAVLSLALGPLLVADAAAVRHDLLSHHAANAPDRDLLLLLIRLEVAVGLMLQACPALALLSLAGLIGLRRQAPDSPAWSDIELCFLVTALVFLGHFVSGHPYQEYQVIALPSAAVLAGLCWGELHRRLPRPALTVAGPTVLVLVAAAVQLPPAMRRLPGQADGPAGVHGPLRQVAQLVAANSRAEEPIFSFQTDVAVEAGRRLTPGLTLASFSFTDDPAAAQHHLVNPALITQAFSSRQPAVVVLSEGDLTALLHGRWTADHRVVVQPELTGASRDTYQPLLEALDGNYRWLAEVPRVGQFREVFSVLVRR